MKPLSALGLALVIVGVLVVLALPALRPAGGALLLCGAALVIYGYYRPRSTRRKRARGPYSWEDTGDNRAPELYTAQPGEVQLKPRTIERDPDFTTAHPGNIPMPRHAATGGAAAYTAEAHADFPEPRDRERAAAEYSPTPRVMDPNEPIPDGPQGRSFAPDLLNSEDPDLPPMAPPPPR